MMLRVIVIMAVWWLAFGQATTYGGIWHSQAHPTQNVEVVFQSGEVVTGDLSRNWDNSWNLTHDGVARTFETSDWRVLRTQPGRSDASYWQMWRSWGPVALVTSICMVALIWPALRRFVAADSSAVGDRMSGVTPANQRKN